MKKLTSITLDNGYSKELSEAIVDYLIKKKIKRIKIILGEELKKNSEKVYTSNNFSSLKLEIKKYLDSDGKSFLLKVPSIKTSWEKFPYGVEANSFEKDFKRTFLKYLS